jgi:hypothetical protein
VCSSEIFNRLIEIVQPIFESAINQLLIIVPPQPRYVFQGCCPDNTHCTNIRNEGYPEGIVGGNVRLRALLKTALAQTLSAHFWVADSCLAIPDAADMSNQDRASALRRLTCPDGVHFLPEAYRNYAKNLSTVILNLSAGIIGKKVQATHANCLSVSGTKRHFWRGIVSPHGSKKSLNHGSHRSDPSKKRSAVPYRREGGGGRESRQKSRAQRVWVMVNTFQVQVHVKLF